MRVDYFANSEDMQAAILGALGMSTEYIAKKTKLTEGQVAYRLAKAKIRRADYRNGSGVLAGVAFRELGESAQGVIRSKLNKCMGYALNKRNHSR